MISDKDRREIARKLRELRRTAPGVTSVGHGYLWSLLWAVFGDELEELDRSDWLERMCSRLADLIEPTIDRDALLALAEELEEDACWEVQTPGDTRGAWRLKDACDRIREALGVVE